MSVWRDDPRVQLRHDGGEWWQPVEVPGWVSLGYCREPVGVLPTFRYHVLHGLLMGHRLGSVLHWSWAHRRSFVTEDARA